MRHYLARTLLYGVGAGLSLSPFMTGAFDESSSILLLFFVLFFLILIIFLITEILPRKNSVTPEAKAQRQDKLVLITPLALSGVGLGAIWQLISVMNNPTGADTGLVTGVIICTPPIILVYGFLVLRVLIRLSNRRLEISKQGQEVDSTIIQK
jgi:hypothetical protein